LPNLNQLAAEADLSGTDKKNPPAHRRRVFSGGLKKPGKPASAAYSVLADHGADFFFIAGLAQAIAHGRLAEEAADLRKRAQVICTGPIRGEQHEHKVARTVIDCFKIDTLGEAEETADGRQEAGQAGMRDRDTFANAGRAKAFALHYGILDGAGTHRGCLRERFAQDMDGLFAARRFMEGNDDPATQQSTQIRRHQSAFRGASH
jgi:hypothetical protein